MRKPRLSTSTEGGRHGGSATSSKFVEAVNPSMALIQQSADNDYGHPTEEVLAMLDGRLVLRNDQDGRIEISSDGEQMWIETEGGVELGVAGE